MFIQQQNNMEATAPRLRLPMTVMLLLLVARLQSSCRAKDDGADFPAINPNRLQFFEYQSITFKCHPAGWRVMRALLKVDVTNTTTWRTSEGSATLSPTMSFDSGKYWCEDGDGHRGDALDISVTSGSVILLGPVLPVKEGDNVTLYCINRENRGAQIAEYYKDGLRIKTQYTGNMSIFNVAASDAGLYKCNISGAGESPASRLAVRGPHEAPPPPPRGPSPDLFNPLWILTLLLVALLLLVWRLHHCRKRKAAEDKSTTRGSRDQISVGPQQTTYAVISRTRGETVSRGDDAVDPDDVTYAVVVPQRLQKKKVSGDDRTADVSQATYAVVNKTALTASEGGTEPS